MNLNMDISQKYNFEWKRKIAEWPLQYDSIAIDLKNKQNKINKQNWIFENTIYDGQQKGNNLGKI